MKEERSEQLIELLRQEKNLWVKNDLLPVLALLNILGEDSNGYFLLPLSKENIIFNMQRITKTHPIIIESKLTEFESAFQDFIDIKYGEYSYFTPNSQVKHPPYKNPCPNPKNSTVYYVLKLELFVVAMDTLDKIQADLNSYCSQLISYTHTIEDLIYLFFLKSIFYTSKNGSSFRFSFFEHHNEDLKTILKKLLQSADIDDKFIDYYLDDTFKLDYSGIEKFLPDTQNLFAIFNSHHFHHGSCSVISNFIFVKNFAEHCLPFLEQLPINSILEKNYTEIKTTINQDNSRLPLFEYKDKTLRFINEYQDKFSKPLYKFRIEEQFNETLTYLRQLGIIKIDQDQNQIVLLSKEKLNQLHDSLNEEKESQRIKRNKEDLKIHWLKSNVNLMELTKLTIAVASTTKIAQLKINKSEKEMLVVKPSTNLINLEKIDYNGKININTPTFKIKLKIKNSSESILFFRIWYSAAWSKVTQELPIKEISPANDNDETLELSTPEKEGEYILKIKILDQNSHVISGQEHDLTISVKRNTKDKIWDFLIKGGKLYFQKF